MSTQAKIEQVNRDIEALVINRAKLEVKLADEQKPEVTYSIGDRFKNGTKYILACTDTDRTVHLVNLEHGSHLSGSVKVKQVTRITQAELNMVFAPNITDPARYWDARLERKC